MNIAIIVAAGSGLRFGAELPKQFRSLAGRPLLAHTFERFDLCPSIDEIVLVLSDDGRRRFESLAISSSKPVTIVEGGPTRAASVMNGLAAVADDDAIVAIHDGARPLVSVSEITNVIDKAQETGAACLTAEITDTIKTVSGGEITGTLDRQRLRRALTPQAFRAGLLRRAFAEYGTGDEVTDECFVVERLGHPVAFVEGSSRNIKVTRPEDIVIAEALIGFIE
ncbi:MAG: 2-C-methyl-D-erythritol 4-phosphate cytidylyltransferase [Acidobacteria bacterium]|nr:2-C-methyl-D-erythritol 4-phosphate cytidylyltransferase [Acidobacteriota bacterium]MCW5949611.1 2-C-methyl-D-erythritol 4-phosphate cytidylyltransferase [Pyrinomonadaceae bacterium]